MVIYSKLEKHGQFRAFPSRLSKGVTTKDITKIESVLI